MRGCLDVPSNRRAGFLVAAAFAALVTARGAPAPGARAPGGAAVSSSPAGTIPSPKEFLGHDIGEDRRLASWPDVVSYLRVLDAASERISIESAGTSTLGNEMPVAILTSEANQKRLDRIREVARRLANPEGLDEKAAEALVADGKAIVLVTGTIHSTEVGSTQMSLEFAWRLASAPEDSPDARWLEDVVLLLMPSINPDGQGMVVDWYRKWLGTEWEGGALPWLYHPYAGHDNNRDFCALNLVETRAVNDLLYRRWFPQVYLDEHQMGGTGPRMFVPPQTDPIAPEVDPRVYRLNDLLGTLMGLRLEEAGKKGVGRDMIYDAYWPGGTRNTAWWKNVVGLLTEVASCRIATPVRVEPGELRGGAKGFPEYQQRSNYPSPWEGGWWRLRDIVDYELVATRSLLESCSILRGDLLRNSWRLNRDAIEAGKRTPPYAFLVPPAQHDPAAAAAMTDLLLRHGVRVHRAEAAFTVGERFYPAGTTVVLAAQPFRPFLLTMLRPQRYPEVTPYAGGPIVAPYDTTTWSFPIAMGVEVAEAESPFAAPLVRIEAPEWPGGPVDAGAGGWLVPHATDTAYALVNRLLADGRPVYFLREGGPGRAPGDVYLPAEAAAAESLAALSTSLHVGVTPLDEAPKGPAFRVHVKRIGLYKPWAASMDEGWTRLLLERYGFPYQNLVNDDLRKGTFADATDVLVLPDVEKTWLKEGKPAEDQRRFFAPLPPEYQGGLEKEGGEHLKKWVLERGGTLVCLDSSADYAIELLELPVANLQEKDRGGLVCPGSMLRLRVDTTHPLGYGLRAEEAGLFEDSPVFETRPPDARFERRVVASYPDDERDILVSGYLRGGERLERRAAVVDLRAGKGRVVLLGFRAQHRAQTMRTFKIFFNALQLAGLEEASL